MNEVVKLNSEEVLHSWSSKEYPYYHKNFAWVFTFFVILVLIVVFQVLQKDYFGGLSVAVIGLLALFYALVPPKTIYILLSAKGIHLDDLFIPYNKMRHFWIVDNLNHKTLNIETRAFLQKILVLELGSQDPEKIRRILRDVLPELDESEPTIAQKFMKKFKF